MKKSTLAAGILIVLGGSYIAASYHTGDIIQENIDNQIAELCRQINNKQDFYQVNMHYSDYQKGIFSTTFRLSINVKDNSDELTFFDDNITIYHGPFPLNLISHGNILPKIASLSYELTKQDNETLWNLAGNRPFLKMQASISYTNKIYLDFENNPIYFKDADSEWDVKKNQISFSTDMALKDISLDLNINSLKYKTPYTYVNIDNLKSSNDFVFDPRSQTHLFNNKLSIKALSLTEDKERTIALKNLVLTNKNNNKLDKQSGGNLNLTIENMLFGRQNIGKALLDAKYQFEHDNVALKTTTVDIDKVMLQTKEGNLEANFALTLKAQNLFELLLKSQLGENNITFFKCKVDLPFKPLSYLIAQISNSQKEKIEQSDLDFINENVLSYISMYLATSPIISINYNPDDPLRSGMYMDLYYSKDESQARIKDQNVSLTEFWHIINRGVGSNLISY